jgi:hypothetical protein
MRWRRDRALEDRRRENAPATSNYASLLGHICLRVLFYSRMGAEKKPHSVRTMAVFRSGEMVEREVTNFMRTEMDLDIVRSQEAAPKTDLLIGCRIDGGARGIHQTDQPYVLIEAKRLNTHQWQKVTDCDIQGVHDLLSERTGWWTTKYIWQAVAYIRLYNEPGLVFVLMDPSTGLEKYVPLPADAPIVDEIWKKIQTRAKYINACVEANDCPDPIPYSKQICGMCDYKDVSCFPERQHEGVEVLSHPDILQAAEEFLELRDMARAFAEKKAYLRELILATKRDHIMLGDVAEVTVRGDKTKTVTIKRPKGGALFFGSEDEDE